MKILLLLLAGLTSFLLFGPDAPQERFLLTGSSTCAPVLAAAAEHLEASGSGFLVDVQTGGSSRGIVDARGGLNGMGMSSRDLKPEEAEGLDVRAFAYDGVGLIVHADNPLDAITREQVIDVFTGRVDDWSAFGGSGPITVVNKAEGRATLEVFLEHFALENPQIAADVVIGDNAQGVRLVSGDPQAIGYVSIGEALHAVEAGIPIKLLTLDGQPATMESVQDGSFPIRRSLYVFAPEFDARGKAILDFLGSAEGRRVIESFSFVPALGDDTNP